MVFSKGFAVAIFLTLAFASLIVGSAIAAPPEGKGPGGNGGGTSSLPKPKLPGAAGAIQVGARGSLADLDSVDRAEMQLSHGCPIEVPTATGSAYSYSLVGKTANDWTLRMGYMVLQSDGATASCYLRDGGSVCCSGWARWFIQVFDNTGKEVYWKLSRAGEANPPPASSADSGDDTFNGYPFSFVISGDTATFYFDWITKARVRLGNAGLLTEVYFMGELTSSVADDVMGPRTALTTFRVWSGGPSWIEPSPAVAISFGASCALHGVAYAGRSPSQRNDGVYYHSTAVGSGVECSASGSTLWTSGD